MAAGYTEKRDSQGRVQVELTSSMPGWLWSIPFVMPIAMWAEMEERFNLKLAIGISLAAFVLLTLWYFLTRKSIRLQINPGARTLGVVTGSGGRVVKMADVMLARIDEKLWDERSDWDQMRKQPGRDDYHYRVELLLRSSEVVPLTSGHGRFKYADVQRFVSRIDMALRSGK